ncbi:MAG TPA: ABC transporter ATP-binding protein [Candidatus Binatia bacterium]|jgi:putative ABC transport system ATP-binding protein|nr:ABC transporter ATP-binding protein [Candidatus Binatia bacterium]
MSKTIYKRGGAITQSSVLSPQHSADLIVLQDVSKIYGAGETAVRAVDQINLSVQTGELVLILGPSGAGKTTLLSLIGGLLRPTSGTVQVAGAELHTLSPSALSRFRLRQIGFVFQSFQLLSALTASENVEVVLRLGGLTPRVARQRAEELLVRLGLGARLTHLPADLSGGEKQRVALARALALHPPLLIADEPTGSLDSRSGEEVIRLLRRLVDEEHRTVLIASHDQRILPVATRVLRCEDGRLFAA